MCYCYRERCILCFFFFNGSQILYGGLKRFWEGLKLPQIRLSMRLHMYQQ